MNKRHLAAVGAAALAVRVTYVLIARPTIRFGTDAYTYHLLGRVLATGHGFVAPYDFLVLHRSRPTADLAPGQSVLLAVAHRAGLHSILSQQLFMAVLGAITPVLVALLAARITGDDRIALLAGLAAAVDPLLFGSDGSLMSETLYTLLGVVLLLLLLRGGRWILAAGAVLGLAVLTRSDGVLLLPFVAAPLLWRRWRALAAVGAVALAVVAPWLVRNEARFHRVVLTNNTGSLLSGANCRQTYTGSLIGGWSYHCAYAPHLPGTDEGDNAAVLRSAGLRYARHHAGRLVAVVVPARIGRGWGLLHPIGQARIEAREEGRVLGTQGVGVVVTWLLLPAFVLGVVQLRRRRVPVAALLGPVLMVTVLFALSYGDSRFREIAEPALLLGAVAGIRLTAFTYRS